MTSGPLQNIEKLRHFLNLFIRLPFDAAAFFNLKYRLYFIFSKDKNNFCAKMPLKYFPKAGFDGGVFLRLREGRRSHSSNSSSSTEKRVIRKLKKVFSRPPVRFGRCPFTFQRFFKYHKKY